MAKDNQNPGTVNKTPRGNAVELDDNALDRTSGGRVTKPVILPPKPGEPIS